MRYFQYNWAWLFSLKAVLPAICIYFSIAIYTTTSAQSSGGAYRLVQNAIANGGGHSSGGAIALQGTIGQTDAGPSMTGGDYRLHGGFWSGTPSDALFNNGFE